ncbi:MAG: PfaD family polyunsaturated fatty acid/polyketide biosynthesis protein [Myxococcota bacterium]
MTSLAVSAGPSTSPGTHAPSQAPTDRRLLSDMLAHVRQPLWAQRHGQTWSVFTEGAAAAVTSVNDPIAYAPACDPTHLGDPAFCEAHGVRYPYIAGAMANGIASAQLVQTMGAAGMLGFFGAAGLSPSRVAENIECMRSALLNRPWGCNLIHSPFEPLLEEQIVQLYLNAGVTRVSASAYLGLTLPLVRYRVHGVHVSPQGEIITPNQVLAKVSRVEVASKFFSPPPEEMLAELVRRGDINAQQAQLARHIPMAQDVTVEADSGGHTDNRPALCLLPSMLAVRDRLQRTHDYAAPLRVGAAGGISTPHSALAAFQMGAAYIVVGSVHQACLEAGTSDKVRQMLAAAEQADVAMAPAADMFEMGVKLQVLKRGTMFSLRAQKLYNLYRDYPGLDQLPHDVQNDLENTLFRAPLSEIWQETQQFWQNRDPEQLRRADTDPKHRMALVFRWYLGQSSRWANAGVPGREVDYQVWCGPAMGAFNEWTRGTFLAEWQNRRAVTVAMNILHGAAMLTRANILRIQGVSLSNECLNPTPRPLAELEECLQ